MVAQESVADKTKSPSKVKDYVLLLKLRLAFLVVLSALSGYLFVGGAFDVNFWLLIGGGFLITGGSNGFNQVLERDLDKKMDRTANRPIPSGRMSINEAIIASSICAVVGAVLLFQLNYYAGILGLLAFSLYVFIYTPLKRITPWAVFVGAFPGAIPPMLGVIAVTGTFEKEAGLIAGMLFLFNLSGNFRIFGPLLGCWMMTTQKLGFHCCQVAPENQNDLHFIFFFTPYLWYL